MRPAFLLALVAVVSCSPEPSASTRETPAAALSLHSPRAVHASLVLPDGRVALLGGCVIDGCETGPASRTVELFDPRTGRMLAGGGLHGARTNAAAAVLPDGRVLLVGGWDGPSVTASAEIYDPASGRSTLLPPLSAPRASAAVAVLPDGSVLIAGGYDGSRALDTAEIFDPATGAFMAARRMTAPRSGATATRMPDGRVLLAGGSDNGASGRQVAVASAEVFDPASGSFTPTGSMAERRYKHATVALQDGRLLVVGGADERDYAGKLRSLEVYDPAAGRFTRAGTMTVARFKVPDAVVVLRDGRVLIAGGAPRPEVFDPRSGATQALDVDLGGSWSFMTASLLPDGRAFLAGGYREGRIDVSSRVWLLSV